jgi:hypothetical protein
MGKRRDLYDCVFRGHRFKSGFLMTADRIEAVEASHRLRGGARYEVWALVRLEYEGWATSCRGKCGRLVAKAPSDTASDIPSARLVECGRLEGNKFIALRFVVVPWEVPTHVAIGIAQHFEDDLPRSAGPYHDWCLEHDWSERAEALRLDFSEAFGLAK